MGFVPILSDTSGFARVWKASRAPESILTGCPGVGKHFWGYLRGHPSPQRYIYITQWRKQAVNATSEEKRRVPAGSGESGGHAGAGAWGGDEKQNRQRRLQSTDRSPGALHGFATATAAHWGERGFVRDELDSCETGLLFGTLGWKNEIVN